MNHHTSLQFLLATMMLSVSTPTASQDIETVVREVNRAYDRFLTIPSLQIHFTLTHEQLAGGRTFAFRTADVKAYRRDDKRRVGIQAELFNGSTMRRDYAWDGSEATSINADSLNTGDYYITAAIQNNMYVYNYYLRYMSYPEGWPPGLPFARRDGDASAHWLPKLLSDNAVNFRPCPERATREFDGCAVVEWPGREVLWFDMSKGYALRKRESHDPMTGALKERTTLRDFQEVGGGVWLPARIEWEEFFSPGEQAARSDKPKSRRKVEVSGLSTLHLPDSVFRIPAPEGVTVHDTKRRVFYTRYGTGANPILASAEQARMKNKPTMQQPVLLYGIAIVLVVLLLLRWIWNRRRQCPS